MVGGYQIIDLSDYKVNMHLTAQSKVAGTPVPIQQNSELYRAIKEAFETKKMLIAKNVRLYSTDTGTHIDTVVDNVVMPLVNSPGTSMEGYGFLGTVIFAVPDALITATVAISANKNFDTFSFVVDMFFERGV